MGTSPMDRLDDAQTPDFDFSGQRVRRGRQYVVAATAQVDPVVGDQDRASIDQANTQVRFSGSAWSSQ